MKELYKYTTNKANAVPPEGYISSKELQEKTGITDRQIHYWRLKGVFGDHYPVGYGNLIWWHTDLLEIIPVLINVSQALDIRSTDLYRRLVNNIDEGFIDLGNNIRLSWATVGECSGCGTITSAYCGYCNPIGE